MMKIKRQRAKWSAVLTSAAMLMINIPVSAEEASPYSNGITQVNGYMEFEQPQVIDDQDLAQLGYSDTRAYEIENAGELAWFVQHFYTGDLETQNVSLADNIDMRDLSSYYSWTPIGYYDAAAQTGMSYNGVFDGNGYSISGIALDQISGNDLVSAVSAAQAEALSTAPLENIAQNALAGVFGYIGSAGIVTELKLENTSIMANTDAAVLAGRNEGTISACITSQTTITSSKSNAFVSDFAADNENVIQSVYSTGFNISNLLSEDQVTPILLNYAPGYASVTGNGSVSAAFTENKDSIENNLFVAAAPEGVTMLDSSQFADGAVAWALNANFSEPKFSQQLGVDSMPVFPTLNGSISRVYRWTLDYADETMEDGVLYTNGTVPESIFADGRQWQMADADGNLNDIASGMLFEADLTLVEKAADTEPSESETDPTEPTTVQPESTTQEPTTETPTTTVQKVDPVYVIPKNLEGFVTRPISEIALPSDSVGYFVWDIDPATVLPAGQESVNIPVSFVPYDTDTYNTITDISVTIKINKLDPTPQEACPENVSLDEGQPLSTVSLPAGWSWLDGNIVPENGIYTAVYTPEDTAVYNTINANVTVTVNPTKPADTTPPEITGITDGETYCEAQTVTVTDENAVTATVNDEPVTLDENGSFTLNPNVAPLTVVATDEAGNATTINVVINDGHTFSEGVCVICGAEDPDYKAPAIESADVPDAVAANPDEDGNWYRTTQLTLTAPTGYYISQTNDEDNFGTASTLDLTLQEGANTVSYYLLSTDGRTISTEKTYAANVDQIAPVISGIEDGKTYCEAQTVTVTDENAVTVTVNDEVVTLDENGSFTLNPSTAPLNVIATDEAGNVTTVNVVVNDGHTFSEGVCVICGAEDPNYNPEPTVDENIPDITLVAMNEDGTIADGQGADGWYRTPYITLTAPDGYNVVDNLEARSRRMPTLDVQLTEGENTISYYLVSQDNTKVSEARTLTLYLDTVAPKIEGLEEGKVYCGAVTFTVIEENLDIPNCSIPQAVSNNPEGTIFTASPTDGPQGVILRDKAGNEIEVHYTVNDGHTFENGVCIYCGEKDPDYKAPATESADVPDAVATTPDADGNWYRTTQITLTAPTGYYISQTKDEATFGTASTLNLTLQEGANTISYYLLSTDGKTISTEKTYTANVDQTAPVISGAEEGKTYCAAPTITVTDTNLVQVTVNGTAVSPAADGTLTIAPASESQTIKAVDAAGNEASLTITVNNGHSYANGICTVCGQYDPEYKVNVDAKFLSQGMGSNGWYRGNATLQAPDGFYIAFTDDRAAFGTNTQIVITEEGSYTMNYYLMNISSGAISQQKQISIKLDKTAPIISGIESDKTYCLDQKLTLTVSDDNLYSVKLNNQEIASANSLQTAGGFTYEVTKAGAYVFTAADAAGNLSTMRFTVNANHTWDAGVVQTEPTTTTTGTKLYTCTVCGTTKTEEIPMVTTEATTPEPTTQTPTTTTQETSTAPSTAPSSSETQPSTAPSTVAPSTAPSSTETVASTAQSTAASSSAAEASSSTLAMPTTQSSQINQILGIEDASSIIGIILVVIGIILAAAVIAMIVLAKRSKK